MKIILLYFMIITIIYANQQDIIMQKLKNIENAKTRAEKVKSMNEFKIELLKLRKENRLNAINNMIKIKFKNKIKHDIDFAEKVSKHNIIDNNKINNIIEKNIKNDIIFNQNNLININKEDLNINEEININTNLRTE